MENIIYIRCETNKHEHRTPIIPVDIKILIDNNFIVYVQKSTNRIFSDEEYKKYGGIITDKNWYDPMFKNALIIGLKEIDSLDKLLNHKHLYFSHSYKNQLDSDIILSSFYNSSSIIYDFEYFLDKENKRLISFGFYAGVMGCILGLLQYIKKNSVNSVDSVDSVDSVNSVNSVNLTNLNYWDTIDEILNEIYTNINLFENINIGIIGSNGNCGIGVKNILDKLNINYTEFGKNSDKSNLQNCDILYNCIHLSETSVEVWFTTETIFTKPIIITDISCDYSKPNNPIKLYNENTTWQNPIFKYNQYVDIIAINNLPSLLPKESSTYFSEKCINLLLQYLNDTNNYWNNNKEIFYKNNKNN